MSAYSFLTRDGQVGAFAKIEGGWALFGVGWDGGHRWTRVQESGANVRPVKVLAEVPTELHEAVCWIYAHSGTLQPDTLQPLRLDPGTYYPRMWRGTYRRRNPLSAHSFSPADEGERRTFNESIVAAMNLFDALLDLFRVVEPVQANASAYGHRIRDLLLLACTEVESHWKGVLRANFDVQERMTTKDYVKLAEPLRLKAATADLTHYSEFRDLRPFSGWSPSEPTKTLSWYAAYNAVKHDRETNFSLATLREVILATAALHLMLAVQWGPDTFDRFHGNYESPFSVDVATPFEVGEIYFPPIDVKLGWRKVRFKDGPEFTR